MCFIFATDSVQMGRAIYSVEMIFATPHHGPFIAEIHSGSDDRVSFEIFTSSKKKKTIVRMLTKSEVVSVQ